MSENIEISADHWKASFAIDKDGVEWICGFFNGKFCRVAVSKPQQLSTVN
jgi:hypothetical protein